MSKIILTGDLNLNQFNINNKYKELTDILRSYGIKNHVKDFTRIKNGSATSIDYFCSNFFDDDNNWS